MTDSGGGPETPGRRKGCLVTLTGSVVLVVMAIPVALVRWWRARRRGDDVRSSLEVQPFPTGGERAFRKLDLTLDVPPVAESEFHRRLTDAVVRVAEGLRCTDDVYHLAYRLRWEEGPVVMPVGPQIQELGERFSLALSQGSLEGRTALWLTLDRGCPLAEVIDPLRYDPEADGEPETLISSSGPRWAMATSWARVGPSLVVRLLMYVSEDEAENVAKVLNELR